MTETSEEKNAEGNFFRCNALLGHWLTRFAELEAAYKAASEVLGCPPDSPLIAAMYGSFDDYTKMLAKVVGDEDGWLDWYLWENGAGSKGLPAKAAHQKKEKPVRTLDDLCRLLRPKRPSSPDDPRSGAFRCSAWFGQRGREMSALQAVEKTYPSGAKYFELRLHNRVIGSAVHAEGGFLTTGKRKPVATLELAAKQCLDTAISQHSNEIEKLRQMMSTLLRLNAEINPPSCRTGESVK